MVVPLRTAIVTGSARGIGKAIALRLARDGYSVCVNDIPSAQADIDSVVSEINQTVTATTEAARTTTSRPRAIGIAGDVTESSSVKSMISGTVDKLGPLTLMVANAGIACTKPALAVTEEEVRRMMDVNVLGVFNCYTLAAKQMIAQGPPKESAGVGMYKIVGASSIAGYKAMGLLTHYSASKFAVRGLTQGCSQEFAPHQITVNAYAPGIVGTKMWEEIDAAMGDIRGRAKGESITKYSEGITLGRTSVAEDVSNLVGGFLATADSDYVTGQTIIVDGGIVYS